MIFKREKYLNEIIQGMSNDLIKVITGIRRCGKSFIIFKLFYEYLLKQGIKEENIIRFAFDDDNDIDKLDNFFKEEPTKIYDKERRIFLINSKKFRAYIKSVTPKDEKYYLLLDEIQLLVDFSPTLNSFYREPRFDVYVTGSNCKMLSSDIVTTFRGRGDQINVMPLSFSEFFENCNKNFEEAYQEYSYFGGMPLLVNIASEEQKRQYLENLYNEIYIKDIVENKGIKDKDSFERLINVLASSIGSYTSPNTIENTFKSELKTTYHHETIKNHIEYLKDSFLIEEANRYDIKGRKHISSKSKYYFIDPGLRNVNLNFRQFEETHLMENIIYNELIYRGFNVEVGVVEINERNLNGNNIKKQLEVDFVCTKSFEKFYIQSAFSISNEEKLKQEERPLLNIKDSFKKIIVVNRKMKYFYNDNGTLIISLEEFLLNKNSLYL